MKKYFEDEQGKFYLTGSDGIRVKSKERNGTLINSNKN